MLKLKDLKVTIIGAKRSGIALARLVHRLGGVAKISDQGDGPSDLETQEWFNAHRIQTEFNGHSQSFVLDSDLVVLSPGVRYDAPPAKWARDKGLPVLGEIEFAYQFCDLPIIAVTGSNGKTTTSTLIQEVINAADMKACLCGNVGLPFSDTVLGLEMMDYVVLEISSFQLESLLDPESPFRNGRNAKKFCFKGFRPLVAVVLNFSQNHLDRHKDLEEYFEAKKKIFLNQEKSDYAVLNYQNERLRSLEGQLRSKVVFFNRSEDKKSSGTENPNYKAVLEVARILDVPAKACLDVFKNFKGVEHRLEWVRTYNGVEYINDSKATTAEAAGWALKNLQKPIVMICGGRDKNIDYSVLAPLVGKKVKKMIVIGEARSKIRRSFDGVVAVEECDSLDHAVKKASELAVPGDCVVLSPMCASFDMFKDYEDRGKVYKQIVSQLS